MSSLIRSDQSQRRAALPARHGFLAALIPPVTLAVHRSMLAVAVTAAAALSVLTMIVRANPYLQIDASVERWIQAVNWDPLALTFPFFSWIGGPGGIYMQGGALLIVLLLNRRAWILALTATTGGFSYFLLVNFVHRPRPALGEILRVTEHPGGYSFPSGHVIFITITIGLLMLCIGYTHLPRWGRPIGWAVAAAIVMTAGVSRIYVGAHWPTDVLASLTIAVGWLALVTSLAWISNRALYGDAA